MSGVRSLIALAILIISIGSPPWHPLRPFASASLQETPHQEPFRTGVELVTVDVAVVAADGTPIATVTPEDLEVRVDGTVRRVVSLQFLDMRVGERRAGPESTGDLPAHSVAGPAGRRFVFVVDTESMPFGHGAQVLEAAGQFIDGFTPGDRAAVWILPTGGGKVTFTHDTEVIKRGLAAGFGATQSPPDDVRLAPGEALLIDMGDPETMRQVVGRECDRLLMSGRPECGQLVRSTASRMARERRVHAEQTMTALMDLARALRSLEGPTHVVFITDGVIQQPEVMARVGEAAAAAADARVHVHTLQPWSGAWLDQAEHGRPDASASGMRTTSLSGALSLATITGGYAATYVAPQAAFARLARELSAGYLLAFEPLPADRDGKPHTIEVRVSGVRGVTVRSRQQFRIDPSAPPTERAVAASERAEPEPRSGASDRESERDPGPSRATIEATGVGDLPMVLSRLRSYVSQFERELASIVVEERYVQVAKPWTGPPGGPEREPALAWSGVDAKQSKSIVFASRRLRSDVLLVQAPNDMWIGYRDVFEVDGRPVRNRDDRVKRLFLSRSPGRDDELARISHESARYNLGTLTRTINVPTFPLLYLHPRRADHVRFSRKHGEVVDGHPCMVLEFTEIGRPTLVGTPEGRHVPAWGRVWVEPDTGRIRRIEARVEINDARRQAVRVTFGEEHGVAALVPRSMWEWYEGATIFGQGNDLMIEALATYSNLRRFTVTTSETVAR